MIEAQNLPPQDKCKIAETSGRQTKHIITKSMEDNDTDAIILLSMGSSYSQHEISAYAFVTYPILKQKSLC